MGLASVLNRDAAAKMVVEFMPVLVHERRLSPNAVTRHREPNRRLKSTSQKAIAC